MGETKVQIAAPPEDVFAALAKPFEDAAPGNMKVGDHFTVQGQNATFTLVALTPPSQLTISWLYEGMTFIAEYNVEPIGNGSMVRLEMSNRNVQSILGLLLIGVSEDRTERKMLEDLKLTVESKGGQPTSRPA